MFLENTSFIDLWIGQKIISKTLITKISHISWGVTTKGVMTKGVTTKAFMVVVDHLAS